MIPSINIGCPKCYYRYTIYDSQNKRRYCPKCWDDFKDTGDIENFCECGAKKLPKNDKCLLAHALWCPVRKWQD